MFEQLVAIVRTRWFLFRKGLRPKVRREGSRWTPCSVGVRSMHEGLYLRQGRVHPSR